MDHKSEQRTRDRVPYCKPHFQAQTAYALGTPTVPSDLHSRKNGDCLPCQMHLLATDMMLLNDCEATTIARWFAGTAEGGQPTTTLIEAEFLPATRPAHTQCNNSKTHVPTQGSSKHSGGKEMSSSLCHLLTGGRPFSVLAASSLRIIQGF